jgi:hypothetical protein
MSCSAFHIRPIEASGRGFDLVAVHRDLRDCARDLKPSLPLTGNYGIPIRDEIELELRLDGS